MVVFPGNADSVVNVLCHQYPAQQMLYYPIILFVRPYQSTGKADGALFLQGLWLREAAPSTHAGQGQEGGPAKPVLFQIFNQLLGSILIFRDNILDAAAQSCLDGGLIPLIHFDEVRYHALDARHVLFLLHDLADAVAVAIVALGHVPQGFQAGGFPVKSALANLQLLVLFSQLPAQAFGFLLLLPLSFRQCNNSSGNFFQFLQMSFVLYPLLFLTAFRQQQLLIQLRSPNLGLLLHGVVALQAALGGGPLI